MISSSDAEAGTEAAQEHESDIIRAIDAGNCVAFVGAGFSAPVMGGWGAFLEDLAKRSGDQAVARRVGELLAAKRQDNLDFEAAAQLLEDAMRSRGAGLGALVAELVAEKKARPGEDARRVQDRVNWLTRIPFRAVLTTNFDGYLGGQAPSPDVYREVLRGDARRYGTVGSFARPPVVNLHGSIDEPASIVMTRRSYRRRLHVDASYRRFLGTLFSTSTVVYLGFSFTDAYINELRSEVLSMIGDDVPELSAYAVLADVPEPRREFLELHEKIGVIGCTVDDGFKGFDAFLAGLADKTRPEARLRRLSAGRRILWMDPEQSNNVYAAVHMGEGLVTCGTVDEALDRLQRERFDLVLTRFGWRGGPGAGSQRSEAEELLLRMPRPEHGAPVIVFGAHPGQHAAENRRRLLQAGAVGYAWEWDGLFGAIESVLG